MAKCVDCLCIQSNNPVIDPDPTLWRPTQQRLDLRADVSERHGFPLDPPRDGFRRLKQGSVNGAIGFRRGYCGAHEGKAPTKSER